MSRRPGAPRLRRRSLLAALPALLLAACAIPSGGRHGEAEAPQHWSGRLSLVVQSDPPEQFHAAFDLTGSAHAGELALTSPLGTTIAVLQWQPGQAVLQQGGQVRHYASVDALAAAVTGTAIPIASLFAWLHGENATAAGWTANLEQLAQGRISAQRHHPAPAARLRVILQDDGA